MSKYSIKEGSVKKNLNNEPTTPRPRPPNSGWFDVVVDQAKKNKKALGGSYDPASIIAHVNKQEAKIRKLKRENLALRRQLGV